MAVLTASQRNRMPSKSFALPGGRFPIPDKNHARNALARAHFASPAEQSKIRSAVHRKFPSIGKAHGGFTGHMGEMHMPHMKHMSFMHRPKFANGGDVGDGGDWASQQAELERDLNDIDREPQEGEEKIEHDAECPECGHSFACGGMAMKADGGEIAPSDAEDEDSFFAKPRPSERMGHGRMPLHMQMMKHGGR